MTKVTETNSLQALRPNVAKLWSDRKNGDLTPDKVANRSMKVAWWKCKQCGKDFEHIINYMNSNTICKECQDLNRRLTSNIEDSLAGRFPEIVKDWDFSKNGKITPYMIKPYSDIKVHWKCHVCGYEWCQAAYDRMHERTCRVCRRNASRERIVEVSKKRTKYLKDIRPDIYEQIDKRKALEDGIDIEKITNRDKTPIWWNCNKCNCSWKGTTYYRLFHNSECPVCRKLRGEPNMKLARFDIVYNG